MTSRSATRPSPFITRSPKRRATVLAGLSACGAALMLVAVSSPASSAEAIGTVRASSSPNAIPGRYIVVLKDGQRLDAAAAKRLTTKYDGTVSRVFGRAVHGYAASLGARQAARLAADPAVSYVEQDQVMRATATQANPPSWGLDRIDQRNLPLNASYTYGSSSGVRVYVIDTGVRITSQDFGGRASYGYDAVDGDSVASDGNGHGTFVAGVVAGTRFGVAKSASIVAVRVLGNNGSGTTSGVIAGVDWVTANATRPAVANMSLGGGTSSALDAAVQRSIAAGITYAIAAGNSGVNAANSSPARVAQALTVAATDRADRRPSWSNYGSVVDLFAPGVSITSDWRTSDTATYTGSGTSFAAPHVAGAAALYLSAHSSASPATVSSAIISNATTNVVSNPGSGSPNRLLYITGLS